MKRRLLLVALCGSIALTVLGVVLRDTRAESHRTLRSAERTELSLSVRLLAAESTYWRGQYDSARSLWTSLRLEPSLVTDSATVAEIETWLGLAEWRLGHYSMARGHAEFALALKTRRNLIGDLPPSYNALGLIAWTEGRLDDATGAFNSGLRVARSRHDALNTGKLAGNLGLVSFELAHFDSARAGLEIMRQAGVESGDKRVHGNALTNLAMIDIVLGDVQAGITRLQQAQLLYQAIDYHTGEQNRLGQLATAYADLGQLQTAFALLDSANIVAQRAGLQQEVASNLELLGNLYRNAGELRKALEYYSRAQLLNGELGLRIERGTVLRKLAELHERLGITESAVASAAEAARVHEDAGARLEELKDRAFLAERAGSLSSSDYVRMQALASVIATPGALALAGLTEARIAVATGQMERALRRLERDSAALLHAGFEDEAEAHQLRARALVSLGRLAEGITSASRGVAILERVRGSLGSAMLRASFAAQRADSYGLLIEYQLKAGALESAFRTAALVHTRDLSQLTAANDGAARAAAANLVRVRHLTSTLNESAEDQDTSADELRTRERLVEELQRGRAEYESLIARSSWSAANARPVDIRALQSVLRPGEAVLQYLVAGEAVYGFVVTRRAVHGQRLTESPAGLFSKIRVARSFADDGSADVLTSLWRTLIAPFAHELAGARRLIIVPHAALSYLPFAALLDSADGRYLVEKYEVEYLPAIEQLVGLRSAPPIPGTASVNVFAPFPRELPGSRAEARSVSRAWSGKVQLGARASKAGLRAALGSADIVHVSSHAALDAASPLFSFVALHNESGDDGRFEVHDVLATRVRAPLVFLSGCETALGNHDAGANVSTFTHAFLAAGARAVVATLWRVEDESAAQFAASFYKHLRSSDAASALASAQRDLLHSARFRKPIYWAAYTMSGDVTFVRGQP